MNYLDVIKNLGERFSDALEIAAPGTKPSSVSGDKITLEHRHLNTSVKPGLAAKEIEERVRLTITGKANTKDELDALSSLMADIYEWMSNTTFTGMVVSLDGNVINFDQAGSDFLPSFTMNLQVKYERENSVTAEPVSNLDINIEEKNQTKSQEVISVKSES